MPPKKHPPSLTNNTAAWRFKTFAVLFCLPNHRFLIAPTDGWIEVAQVLRFGKKVESKWKVWRYRFAINQELMGGYEFRTSAYFPVGKYE